jgi:hypothetical protein
LIPRVLEETMESPAANLTPPAGRNAAVIANLRRRSARVQRWLYFFLLLMPLGATGLALMIAGNPNATPSQVLGLGGILVFAVGLAGMLLMLGDQGKYRRSLALAEQADLMDFLFIEKPKEDRYAALRSLRVCKWATNHTAVNLLTGRVGEAAVTGMDYTFVIGSGRYARAFQQTVVLLPDTTHGLPDFLLYPRSWVDTLSQLLGKRLIELPEQAEFGRRFALRGDEPEEVAACFTPALVELCLAEKNLVLEAQDGLLVMYRKDQLAKPEEYPELVAEALRLAQALQAAG